MGMDGESQSIARTKILGQHQTYETEFIIYNPV